MGVKTVVFSYNGEYLASASKYKIIRVWKVYSGERINFIVSHLSEVNSMVFSPNGEYLASGSSEEIGMWSVWSGERIKTLTGHFSVV